MRVVLDTSYILSSGYRTCGHIVRTTIKACFIYLSTTLNFQKNVRTENLANLGTTVEELEYRAMVQQYGDNGRKVRQAGGNDKVSFARVHRLQAS